MFGRKMFRDTIAKIQSSEFCPICIHEMNEEIVCDKYDHFKY